MYAIFKSAIKVALCQSFRLGLSKMARESELESKHLHKSNEERYAHGKSLAGAEMKIPDHPLREAEDQHVMDGIQDTGGVLELKA